MGVRPSIELRPATADDEDTLAAMAVLAAHWRGEGNVSELPPELARYVTGFGRPGDAAVVAERAGEPVSAAWYRLLPASEPGYGFVAAGCAELSIGVRAEHRGAGVGTRLLTALLARARADGVRRVSLSVEFDNPASRFYRRAGFEVVGTNNGAWTMVVLTDPTL